MAFWKDADPRNAQAQLILEEYADGAGERSQFLNDMAHRLWETHYFLTDGQRDAVIRGAQRQAQRMEREQIERPVPEELREGRATIVGKITTCKSKVTEYGQVTKMMVFDDRGFQVWSTMPATIMEGLFRRVPGAKVEEDVQKALDAGLVFRVKFDIKLKVADDNEALAFGSRPTKDTVLLTEQ